MAIRPVGNYPTKPFDCWQKCKELRGNLYEHIATAREDGKVLATGSVGAPTELLAGFGEFEHLGGEPYGASCGNFQDFAMEAFDAYEAAGYARDHCAYLRGYIGSVLLDRFVFGGPFPRPDFVLTCHMCDSHGKWYQIMAEHWGIPYYVVEGAYGQKDTSRKHHLDYYAAQFYDFIDWAEKLLKRKFDDEKFVEALINAEKVGELWVRTCQLNQNIPAPIDQKSMYTFYLPAVHMKHKKEAAEFYQILHDEVEDRVAQGIAALPTERRRLVHENIPPWYGLRVLRFMEKYGVVCIGSRYVMGFGGFQEQPDGTWDRSPNMAQRGVTLKTREDAVRELAWRSLRGESGGFECISKASSVVFIAKNWKADGVVWHLNRGCEGVSLGDMEARLAVQRELGLPTLVYEGNQGDRREWNEAEVLDRIQAFLEGSLGLERLAD